MPIQTTQLYSNPPRNNPIEQGAFNALSGFQAVQQANKQENEKNIQNLLLALANA
jgi:hypothetical protein